MKTSFNLLSLVLLLFQASFAQTGKLEVTGSIIIGDSKEGSPLAGTIRWNGADLEGYNGVKWVSLTDGKSGPVTDRVGNTYSTVSIGGRVWMAENLRTSQYADGTIIPNITDDTEWDNETSGAWCWFENNSSYAIPHGRLYNWHAVNDTELCPIGWGVPSDTDFENLAAALGGLAVAGSKLKQEGTSTWIAPNSDATNESGFTAVGSGGRVSQGQFSTFFGYSAQFWTTSEHDADKAWYYRLVYNGTSLATFAADKNFGYAVRCIKDE